MTPTIFMIQKLRMGDADMCSVVRSGVIAVRREEDGALYPLECLPQAKPFADFARGVLVPTKVREVGSKLLARLTSDPTGRQAVEHALQHPSPIYIHLRSDDAEELPWETLYCTEPATARGFLALRACPIGRISGPTWCPQTFERSIHLPLRIAIVLAAEGARPEQEWKEIHKALAGLKNVSVLLLTNDPGLLKTIRPQLPAFVAQTVGNQETFLARVRAHRPHILHFFCHGTTVDGPHLRIATPTGSTIIVEAGMLTDDGDLKANLLLVTLNCCQSAQTSENVRSLARTLAIGGLPVVIGMRETVAEQDANLFTEHFYEALATQLKPLLAGAPFVDIEWALTLDRCRQGLRDRYVNGVVPEVAAMELKEWTLPVLYVQGIPFRLRAAQGSPEVAAWPDVKAAATQERRTMVAELHRLRLFRRRLATVPDTPASILESLEQSIEQLEQALLPTGSSPP